MIIAVDFDGVLASNNFPEVGDADILMIRAVKDNIIAGNEVVLWTSRADEPLKKAVEWCKDHGLEFCAINDNSPSNKAKWLHHHPNGTRKVFADYYIDDHGVGYSRNGAIDLLFKLAEEKFNEQR